MGLNLKYKNRRIKLKSIPLVPKLKNKMKPVPKATGVLSNPLKIKELFKKHTYFFVTKITDFYIIYSLLLIIIQNYFLKRKKRIRIKKTFKNLD